MVVLPSPRPAGLMAVTRMSLPGACSSLAQQVVIDLQPCSFRTAQGTSRRRRMAAISPMGFGSVAWAISMSVNTSGPSFSCRGAQAYLAASSIDGAARPRKESSCRPNAAAPILAMRPRPVAPLSQRAQLPLIAGIPEGIRVTALAVGAIGDKAQALQRKLPCSPRRWCSRSARRPALDRLWQ